MWSMDSLIPTGGTIRATRLPLVVVIWVSSSSTMMIGEDYELSTLGCADRILKTIFKNLMIKHIRLDASILQVVRY